MGSEKALQGVNIHVNSWMKRFLVYAEGYLGNSRMRVILGYVQSQGGLNISALSRNVSDRSSAEDVLKF